MTIQKNDRTLYDLIELRYNDSELRTLCFRLKVNYEDLIGESRADKIRELVLYCERHSLLTQLRVEVMNPQPGVFEPGIIQDRSGQRGIEVKAIDAWISALEQSPTIQNRDTRQAALAELPVSIRNSLNTHLPTLNTQLRDLVKTCQNYPDGLLYLVKAIRMQEDNSLAVQRLESLL